MYENDLKSEEFESCFCQIEQELYGYIYRLIPNHADARDVLQETAVRLWLKFEQYDQKRPFSTWARKFAHTQVLKARERGRYRTWMSRPFRLDVAEVQTMKDKSSSSELEPRQEVLEQCLEELEPAEMNLLRQRYWDKVNLRSIASELKIPECQIYRQLYQIRSRLQQCMANRLAEIDN